MRPVNALRVLVKAAVIFVLLNVLFAWLNPPVGKATLYNWLWPGRVRFPYSDAPQYYSLDYNVPIIQDLDALFDSHIISAAPKAADEYRVYLLGDSATWGVHVSPEDMLAAQINSLALTSCDGRRVVAYDLGYPWPSLLRDLLMLDRAMPYKPDMVLWLTTLHAFEMKRADREFLVPHADRMLEIAAEYSLELPRAYTVPPPPTFWERTIVGQRARLKKLIMNQAYGMMWAATGFDNSFAVSVDHLPLSQDVAADETYFDYRSPDDAPALVRSLLYDTVRVGREMAGGAPTLVVNEPIYIVSGQNSEVRYNRIYTRWAYDAYRQAVSDWMKARGYPYFDFWDALPASEFANDMTHRDPKGEADLANLLAPIIGQYSCP